MISFKNSIFAAIFVALAVPPGIGWSQNLRWDVTTGDGSTVTDGPGTSWTAANRWNNGTTNTNWTNGSNATFGGGASGTAGTVSLTGGVTAGSVTFNTPFAGNYTISTGTNALTVNSGITANTSATISSSTGSLTLGGNNNVSVAGGSFLTVSSPITDGVNTFSLTKQGTGTLELLGTNTYGGTTSVSAGTLILTGNNSGATGAVNVASGATLGGYQLGPGDVVGGPTTVAGTLSPGGNRTTVDYDSLGLQSFNSSLTLQSGSTFVWDLITNDSDPLVNFRGFNYDAVDANGGLTIQSGVTSRLRFNSAGSDVDWTDTFWQSNHSWLVFDNLSAPTLGNPTSIFSGIEYDGFGPIPGSPFARFAWQLSGSDVYLNFTAVPEPAGFGTSALMLILYANRRKRRQRNRKQAAPVVA